MIIMIIFVSFFEAVGFFCIIAERWGLLFFWWTRSNLPFRDWLIFMMDDLFQWLYCILFESSCWLLYLIEPIVDYEFILAMELPRICNFGQKVFQLFLILCVEIGHRNLRFNEIINNIVRLDH
jgi:hypothetical protein